MERAKWNEKSQCDLFPTCDPEPWVRQALADRAAVTQGEGEALMHAGLRLAFLGMTEALESAHTAERQCKEAPENTTRRTIKEFLGVLHKLKYKLTISRKQAAVQHERPSCSLILTAQAFHLWGI